MAKYTLEILERLYNVTPIMGIGEFHGERLTPAQRELGKRAAERRKAARRYRANAEKVLAAGRSWRERNKDRCARNRAAWKLRNPEKEALIRHNQNLKRKLDPTESINRRLRGGIKERFRSAGRAKVGKLKERVGYTIEELCAHIERQFLPGMSWANRSKWHIDHIIPLASFKFTSMDDPEFRAAWALANLRPLWASDNCRKGKKRETLL